MRATRIAALSLLPYQPRQEFIDGRRFRVEVKDLVLGVPEFVGGQLFPQGFAPDEPTGDGFKTFPATIAVALQIHTAAQW